jgi:heptosyltransferase I
MPRILIVKTSSMGDVIHAFPALADLKRALPDANVDWLVEAGFAGIARLHPGIDRVITCELRKWRKAPFSAPVRAAFAKFKTEISATPYDAIVDLQGLLKSAWLSSRARGPRCGYDWASAREPLASVSYQKKFVVTKAAHAVVRNRALLAKALQYENPAAQNSYGLQLIAEKKRLVVCFHATSRDDKLWSEANWRALIAACGKKGYEIGLPWGSPAEEARAHRLAQGFAHAKVWPRDPFAQLGKDLSAAACVVGVDTGLLHLAAAVGAPVVGVYVSTEPGLSGAWGGDASAINLGGVGRAPSVDDVLRAIAPHTP